MRNTREIDIVKEIDKNADEWTSQEGAGVCQSYLREDEKARDE